MTHDSAQEFIHKLAEDLRNGYHVVPFIGAGFSLSAGYPTTKVLADHLLPYWIVRALGLNPFVDVEGPPSAEQRNKIIAPKLRQWSPIDGWWPSAGEELLASNAVNSRPFTAKKATELLDVLLADQSKSGDAQRKRAKTAAQDLPATLDTLDRGRMVIEKGDWMSMLQFISRLSRPTVEQPQITCGPERQSVVDSLFLHLNRQCQPALAHEMLAALQGVWRCRVILTTNFDTLIEGAFTNAREPLETFEVGKTSPLPDCNLVLAQPSLVKLHGGRFDVRADVTVGSPLGREDIKNAMSYVAGRNLFREDMLHTPAAPKDKVALVFIGCGDSDDRTMSFAEYVSQHFTEDSKVYWISYTEKRLNKIKTIRSFFTQPKFTVHYSDFGLLLLSLYEHLTDGIPPKGAINPSPWQLSSPPRIPKQDHENVNKALDTARQALRQLLFEEDKSRYRSGERKKIQTEILDAGKGNFDSLLYFQPILVQGSKPIWLRLTEKNYAAAAICLAFFEKARDYGFKGLWIDLDEVTMPAGVLVRIVMMIHRMEGVIDPLTTLGVDALEDEKKAKTAGQTIMDALKRHHADTGVPLIAFLNASEPPGTEALFRLPHEEPLDDQQRPRNRWHGPNAEGETGRLMEILAALATTPACGVKFVIVAPEKRADENKTFASVIDNVVCKWSKERLDVLTVSEQCTVFDPEEIARSAAQWVKTGAMQIPDENMAASASPASEEGFGFSPLEIVHLRAVFMAVVIKFRQSRYPSALARITHSYCLEVGRKNLAEWQVQSLVKKWLSDLENSRVLRRRDGGFVWMNNRVQRKLREKHNNWMEGINCQILHGCIARWHARLLFSCSDPLSATEGISHHLRGVKSMLKQSDAMLDPGQAPLDTSAAGSWEDAHAMIDHAEQLLNTSRVLFERRIATSFSDRSFEFLIEEVNRLVEDLAQREIRLRTPTELLPVAR